MEKNNLTVVVVNGKPRSGKDTFCMYASDYCEINDVDTIIWSTVDAEREAMETLNLIYNPDSEKDRKFLSAFKKFLNNYYDLTMRDFINITDVFQNGVLFVFSREWDEILRFSDYCKENNIDFLTLFLTSPNSKEFDNASDRNCDLEKELYDIIIENNGDKQELKKNAEHFCETQLF